MSQDARKAEIVRRLHATRDVTLRLLERVPDAAWDERVHDFYSPVGWHFGHIGMTEEFWTWHRALGRPPGDEDLYFLFANLPENSKDNRAARLPSQVEVVEYLEATRRRTLAALDAADLSSPERLLTDGYAWEFARLHECQHQETVAELLQLLRQARTRVQGPPGWRPMEAARRVLDGRGVRRSDCVPVPGGRFRRGSGDPLLAYDNERPAHETTVAPFRLDREPVSVWEWIEFLAEGGYQRPDLWTPEGWSWRCDNGVEMPEYWRLRGDGSFGYVSAAGVIPIDPLQTANALSWYEADAYARWIGKRLPTEVEWEYAATLDPVDGRTRTYPWGDARPTPSHAAFGLPGEAPPRLASASASRRSEGANACGILDMAGGVWEWTASPFLPYPGFEAFPYDGYSKDHMDGKHYVCKGGSWATAADILRPAFRNWYVPTYRQGFLGVRCAADD